MKIRFQHKIIGVLAGFLILACVSTAWSAELRTRIFIVDSYHPEYLWSQDTAAGAGQALVDFGFLDNIFQVEELNSRYSVESSRSVIKKAWMDTKRKNSKLEIADATARIVNEIKVFNPDIIFLGDDNAANYIGNHFMDREIPVVFWGINGSPFKYGLIDSLELPGHNVTGIYQQGYIKECLEHMVELVRGVMNVAVLAEDSETGRAKVKNLQSLAAKGMLPVKLLGVGVTNSFLEWKKIAQRFADEADAFVLFNHNTLKDENNRPVDPMVAGEWYLRTVQKPDCSDERQFAIEGILLVVDDSGFKQGYEGVRYGHHILRDNTPPAEMPVKALERGKVIANGQRAAQLGISLEKADFVEELIERSLAHDLHL